MKKILVILVLTIICCINLTADLNEGLVAYYPFSGNPIDESGSGNDGTVTGASLTTDRFGDENSAYYFDGDNDYIIVNEDNSLDFIENENFTICCWINTISNQSTRIIMKRNGTNGHNWYSVFTRNNSSNIGVELSNNYPTNYFTENGNVIVNNGVWHFVTIQRVSSTSIKIFDNGILDTVCSDFGFNLSNSSDLYIATYFDSPAEPTFNGKIDDIRIYNRALSEEEIQVLYHLGNWMLKPENITIITTNGSIFINWDPVIGANSYKVYSSYNPCSTFEEDLTGEFIGTNWSTLITITNKFYYVTAVN